MKRKFSLMLALAVVGVLAVAGTAAATVTLNSDGTGFVGKGDVQLIYGWNNAQLQNNASLVRFQVSQSTTTEYSWQCLNGGGNDVNKSDSTTTTTQGVVDSIARVKNQITGFNLNGYSGEPVVTTVPSGPARDACGNGQAFVDGSDDGGTITASSGGLQVSTDGTTWFNLT